MNVKIFPYSTSSVERRAALVLLALVFAGSGAYAEKQDIVLKPCTNIDTTYAAKVNQAIPGPADIEVANAEGQVKFTYGWAAGCTLQTSPTTHTCAAGGGTGITVTHPAQGVFVAASEKITLTGTPTSQGAFGIFTATVNDQANPANECKGDYFLHVVGAADPGGWGDPHLITANGAHYDFQSAGEFTALRQDGFEVQTRQTPVPTTSIPGTNEYTGLAVCVSIYTAVAARIGSNTVTYQPNLKEPSLLGQADPSGMQLRVNKQLVTLTDRGIDLLAGGGGGGGAIEGRVVPRSGGGIEITDVRGTQVVVTPTFWSSQQKWYLDVNVYQTSAIQGTMGLTTSGWLPALRDGTSLGKRPEPAQQRYQQLYETFADSWRVTAATSLFDYEPGTNTGTFTLDEWPRFNPQSCAIQGQTSAQPTTQQAAEQACAPVTNPAQKADCIFDVMVTGETGFAQSYVRMQGFQPHGTGFQPVLAVQGPPTTPPPPPPPPRWWLWILILILVVIVILWIVRRKTP